MSYLKKATAKDERELEKYEAEKAKIDSNKSKSDNIAVKPMATGQPDLEGKTGEAARLVGATFDSHLGAKVDRDGNVIHSTATLDRRTGERVEPTAVEEPKKGKK